MTVEHLEKRVELLERVVEALGQAVMKHLPSLYEDLVRLGAEWTAAEEKINEEQK